jgi:hypothetical protein
VDSFKTTGSAPPPPAPILSTGAASGASTSGVTLTGTVNPDGLTAAYEFIYGTSPAALTHSSAPALVPAGLTAQPVRAGLSGLRPGTTYYYRLIVSAAGQGYAGAIQSFRTATPRPGGSIGKATAVKSKSATVQGSVDPNGFAATYYFQYGTSTRYGHSTHVTSAGSGATAAAVTGALSGLKAKTRYHYRLVITGPGGTIVSADRTFKTTKASRKRAPRLKMTVPFQTRRSVATLGLEVRFSCNEACSVAFGAQQQLGGVLGKLAAPLDVASGARNLAHAGAATAWLRVSRLGRKVLERRSTVHLEVGGTASNQPGVSRLPTSTVIALR